MKLKLPKGVMGYAVGYAAFCVAQYAIAKATAGTPRTSTTAQNLLGFNDSLGKINALNWILGTPTAPLALPAGVTPVVTTTDVVVGG